VRQLFQLFSEAEATRFAGFSAILADFHYTQKPLKGIVSRKFDMLLLVPLDR
jgi:hypothetical protein